MNKKLCVRNIDVLHEIGQCVSWESPPRVCAYEHANERDKSIAELLFFFQVISMNNETIT